MRQRGMVARFLSLVRGVAPGAVPAAVALMVALALTEGIGILCLLPLLRLVGLVGLGGAGDDSAPSTSSLAWIAGHLPHSLAALLTLYVGLIALRALIEVGETHATSRVEADVTRALRERVYRSLVRARWEVVAPLRASRVSHVLTVELERVSMATWQSLRALLELSMASVYAAAAIALSPRLSLIGAVAALLVMAVSWWPQRIARRDGERLTERGAALFAGGAEELSALKVARSAGAGERIADAFATQASQYADAMTTAQRHHRAASSTLTLGAAVTLALVVWVAVERVQMPVSQLLVLLFLCARLVPRLLGVQASALLAMRAMPAVETVLALVDDLDAAREPSVTGSEMPLVITQSLACAGVTYTYPGASGAALQDVAFEARAGELTAIVGPSGAGKSTLVDVLLGLLHPAVGAVLVDGRVVDDTMRESLRATIAYVPQDTMLFHDSVRENVRWLRPTATDGDVLRALEQAGATALVARLPRGLDTIIGDRGVLLSGGERQRLSLARALVREPRALILDEATSALDAESEVGIRTTLAALVPALTLVVVTHRLSSVRGARHVVVMDGGRVVEEGPWAALIARDGSRLGALWSAQEAGHHASVAPVAVQSS